MKLRKSFLTLLMTIATIIVAGIFNASYAAIGSMHLDIKMLRRSGYGYQALEKNIWKIVETNAEATTWNYDKTIYCLKGGPGFGSNVFGSGTTTAREYTRYYDMKDPGSIPEPYSNPAEEKANKDINKLKKDNIKASTSKSNIKKSKK